MVKCDNCSKWYPNNCSDISDSKYKKIQMRNCVWICPHCENQNVSTSFCSSSSGNTPTNDRFDPLTAADDKNATKDTTSKCRTGNLNFVSININGIRGKKVELQEFLDSSKPDVVALQETRIDKSISNNERIPVSLGYC